MCFFKTQFFRIKLFVKNISKVQFQYYFDDRSNKNIMYDFPIKINR